LIYQPSTYKPDESIFFLIARNQLMFERIGDQRLKQFGISSSQLRVMILIDYLNSPTASQIAATVGSNAAATVRTLDRLEKKEWIRRIRSSQDRRVINLTITPKAKEIIDQLMPHVFEFLNNALNGVTPDEFSTVKKVLGIIANNHLHMLEAMQVAKV